MGIGKYREDTGQTRHQMLLPQEEISISLSLYMTGTSH